MSAEPPILRLEGVSKSFGRLEVLRGVSAEIEAGRTTVVIGPSGCGKSVLLKHMVGLIRPDKGTVWFRDEPISLLGERQLVPLRRKMGFLFQGAALFDSMTVEQNIIFPLQEHGVGTPAEQREICRHVLHQVGLEGVQSKYPEELSGGQRKRVGLARAIVLDPDVIFYDEPTTGLDPIRADLINELILKLQRQMGTTAVVVTHDMASARKVGDRVLMLHGGKFIADTTPDQLHTVNNETVLRFVNGEASPDELAQLEFGSEQGFLATAQSQET